MEAVGQFQELKMVSCFCGEDYGVSSVAFDPQEDLLWAATYGVSSIDSISCTFDSSKTTFSGSRDFIHGSKPGPLHGFSGSSE